MGAGTVRSAWFSEMETTMMPLKIMHDISCARSASVHGMPSHILYLWHLSDMYDFLDSVSATCFSAAAASQDQPPRTTAPPEKTTKEFA